MKLFPYFELYIQRLPQFALSLGTVIFQCVNVFWEIFSTDIGFTGFDSLDECVVYKYVLFFGLDQEVALRPDVA